LCGDEDRYLGHDFGQGSDFRVISQKSKTSQKSLVFFSFSPQKTTSGALFFA
jgi:hypothetical protein